MKNLPKTLYEHIKHPYQPRNVNVVSQEERQGINDRVAVVLTKCVGSMPTAYLFILLALIGLLGILGILPPLIVLLVAWTSQTLIQLVLLPVIMVGQNVLNRHSELMADEQFQTTQKSEHLIEQIIEHLNAQDRELLRHSEMLLQLLAKQNEVPHV